MGLPQPHGNELFDEWLGKRRVDRKPESSVGPRVPGKVISEFRQHGTAVGQVAEVVLEGCEPRDHPPVDPKGRHPVGDALLRVRNDPKDRLPELTQGALLGLD